MAAGDARPERPSGTGRDSHSLVQGSTADWRSRPMGQEVIFAVHGDGPVGLDGPRVELDDERAVLALGGVGGDARDMSAGVHARAPASARCAARGGVRPREVGRRLARVTRTGASVVKLLRAGSGFWNADVSSAWKRPGASTRSVCACRKRLARRCRRAWQTIEGYPKEGEAQIAESVCGDRRLIVRRTRPIEAHA
jgi:hypothetical protein